MISPTVRHELLNQLEALPSDQQQRVLDFARSLAVSPQGVAGKELVRFSGVITSDDAQAMAAAVETACEQVNSDEW